MVLIVRPLFRFCKPDIGRQLAAPAGLHHVPEIRAHALQVQRRVVYVVMVSVPDQASDRAIGSGRDVEHVVRPEIRFRSSPGRKKGAEIFILTLLRALRSIEFTPRRLCLASGGYVYHVLNHAVERARIFRKSQDYAAFERVLEEANAWLPISWRSADRSNATRYEPTW